MARPAPKVELSARQLSILNRLSQSRTQSHRLVERSSIVLMASQGMSGVAIAAKLGVDAQRVRRWRNRWVQQSGLLRDAEEASASDAELRKKVVAVLLDAARPGTPPKFSAEQVARLTSLACEPPSDSGLPITHWTPAELAEEARKRGIVEEISARHLDRLLKRGRDSAAQEPVLADFEGQAREA